MRRAVLFIFICFVFLWSICLWAGFGYLYSKWYHKKHKPRPPIQYHFVTDYTEYGWPLKGGEGFSKEQYEAAKALLRGEFIAIREPFTVAQMDQIRKIAEKQALKGE